MPEEQLDQHLSERRPVLAGLLALVGVGIVVGMIAGLAVLVGTRVLGIGDADATTRTTSGESMYLPKPERTQEPTGPLITLAPGNDGTGKTEKDPSEQKSSKEPKEDEISLSASQTEVGPMEQIDLTGVYPGGEGAILRVQRFEGGEWTDFPVTASVSNETFATYVQTSQGGVNRFRVVDTDTDLASNEVRVTVG